MNSLELNVLMKDHSAKIIIPDWATMINPHQFIADRPTRAIIETDSRRVQERTSGSPIRARLFIVLVCRGLAPIFVQLERADAERHRGEEHVIFITSRGDNNRVLFGRTRPRGKGRQLSGWNRCVRSLFLVPFSALPPLPPLFAASAAASCIVYPRFPNAAAFPYRSLRFTAS